MIFGFSWLVNRSFVKFWLSFARLCVLSFYIVFLHSKVPINLTNLKILQNLQITVFPLCGRQNCNWTMFSLVSTIKGHITESAIRKAAMENKPENMWNEDE